MCRNRGDYVSDLDICRRATDAEIDAEVALRMEEYLTAQKSGDPYTEIRTRTPNPPEDMRTEAARKLDDYRKRLSGRATPEDARAAIRDMKRLAEAETDDDYGLPEPPRPDWADKPDEEPLHKTLKRRPYPYVNHIHDEEF